MDISLINSLGFEGFTEKFGNVIEHCPIVAAAAWSRAPFSDIIEIQKAFDDFVDRLPLEGQVGILRCHPDLAGRMAEVNQLTDESKLEQKAAGLDELSPAEKETLRCLNQQYKDKFQFPFVICARQNKKDSIMKGIAARFGNDVITEVQNGVTEVKKIGSLRLSNLVDSKGAAKL